MTTTLPPPKVAIAQQSQADNWDFSSNTTTATSSNHNEFNPFSSSAAIPISNANNFYSNPVSIPQQNLFTQPVADHNPNPFLSSTISIPPPAANPFLDNSNGPLSPNPFLGGGSVAAADPYSQAFNSMSYPNNQNQTIDPQLSQKALQEQMALQQMALQQKALQEQIATQQRLLQEQQQKLIQDQMAMQQKALQEQMAMQQKLILEQQQALQQQAMQQQQQHQLYQQQSQVPASKPVAKALDTTDYFSNLNLGQPNEVKDSVPDMWKSWEKPAPTVAVATVVPPVVNHTISNQNTTANASPATSDPYGLLAAQQLQQQQMAAMQSQQMMYNYPPGYYNNGAMGYNNYPQGYYNGMQMMQGYDPATYQQQQYYQVYVIYFLFYILAATRVQYAEWSRK